MDLTLVTPILEWAWGQLELQQAVRDAYRVASGVDLDSRREGFFSAVKLWLSGATFVQLAGETSLSVDDILGVHSKVLTFVLQTIVEQAIALLEKALQAQGRPIAPVVLQFPEYLRFGVPTSAGRMLAAGGMAHRCAYVAIGNSLEHLGFPANDRDGLFSAARELIEQDMAGWRARLGSFVLQNTLQDLA